MYGEPLSEDELKELTSKPSNRVHHCPTSDANDIYFHHLLPRFLRYAEDEGFDVLHWNKQNSSQPFGQVLEQTFNNWVYDNVLAHYILIEETLYLTYCSPKDINGLPHHDPEERKRHLDKHKLFSVSVYSMDLQSLIERDIKRERKDGLAPSSSEKMLPLLWFILGILVGVVMCLRGWE